MIAVVGVLCERHTPLLSLGNQPRPSTVVLVDLLFAAHLVISATVARVVPGVDEGWGRWLMWAAVLASIPVTWLVGVGANMATTGVYL